MDVNLDDLICEFPTASFAFVK